MFSRFRTLLSLVSMVSLSPLAATGKNLGWSADALAVELAAVGQLPPPSADVAELKFGEIYTMPVGERGLELSAKARALAGKRVRIVGFMVKQTRPAMGVALLTPFALSTHEGEYGLCDDLPPATIFVEVPKFRGIAVPFTPGPLLLTGTLEVGSRTEPDGRVSHLRLRLDPEIAVTATAPAKPATP